MTKEELKEVFDRDIMTHLNSVLYYDKMLNENAYRLDDVRGLVHCELSRVSALVWTANSLNIIDIDEWEIINETLMTAIFRY